jgi:uncharacterized repeat protein (TIGR03803 family)
MRSTGQLGLWKTIALASVFCAATAIACPADSFKILATFDGTNGANPAYGFLVQGFDGELYGTTYGGGANGYGTVFKITPDGRLTTLYSFCSHTNCTDGSNPYAGLVQATDGNFYGTTSIGGANNGGTVFKITPDGRLTTLYSFCSHTNCTDGSNPYAGLVQATDGNFYGTTLIGGANNGGTVFKMTAGGALDTLHSFDGTDGDFPHAGLVQATDGDFYGTTWVGGVGQCQIIGSCGTVFKITPGGTLTTLQTFDGTDGNFLFSGLMQAANGAFYGTTAEGGVHTLGTVFKITTAGKLATLHSFCYKMGCPDGGSPLAELVQGTDGNFYGTTGGFDAGGYGTVFKTTPSGVLTTLHRFDFVEGANPYAGLVQATDGNFYGTTYLGGRGGEDNQGTVFRLCVGLRPFVVTNPTSGKVGRKITILGNNLTDATSVRFDGTPANFKVVRSSEITTIVPTGATTGFVTVTIPSGTLKGNVVFHVKK